MRTEQQRLKQNDLRVEKVLAWLTAIEEAARDLELELLSRDSELASETGTDPEPRLVRCRHPAVNRRGRLCLSCMGTGFITEVPDVDGERVDPYLLDLVRDTSAVTRDQSEASRKARNLAQLDASIESLERAARQREGLDVAEGETRLLRVLASTRRVLGRDGRAVLVGLGRLREQSPYLWQRALDRDKLAIALLAQIIQGRIQAPS